MVLLAIGPGTGTQVMGFKCFFIDFVESFKRLHCKIGGSVLRFWPGQQCRAMISIILHL